MSNRAAGTRARLLLYIDENERVFRRFTEVTRVAVVGAMSRSAVDLVPVIDLADVVLSCKMDVPLTLEW